MPETQGIDDTKRVPKNTVVHRIVRQQHCEKCGLGDYGGYLLPFDGGYLVLLGTDMQMLQCKRLCKADIARVQGWIDGTYRLGKPKSVPKGHSPLTDYLDRTGMKSLP